MIQDIDNINVSIQDDNNVNVTVENDSINISEGTPTDIAEIMHNEEIRQENEAQRILNENERILNEDSREDYIADLKQKVEDGDFDGEDGTDGVDGISPTVTMTKQGKVTTLTITDKDGEHTTEIRDGNDGSGTGDMLKATYDTNDNGVVDNAEKVNNHTVNSDVPANAVFTDTTYTAGTGIEITNNVISSTQSNAEWGNITGTLSDQTDLQNALDNKQSVIDSSHMLDADLVDDTNASNKFLTTSAQDIWGKKTFQSLPEYAYTTNPVLDTQFVHKKYVDSKFMYQRDTMPTAGEDYYNKIFQYIGTANANYTNGYFYKCERSGTSPNYTYSWVRTDVQPSFSGDYNDLTNKPTIPDELADLSDDSTHRVVTDTEKTTWSGKQDALVSGTNIKTINNTSLLGSGDIEVGADIPQQNTAPSNPQEDDLWIDTNTNQLKRYNGSSWENVGPAAITVDSIVSTSSTNPIENQAITNYVNDLLKYSTTEHKTGEWIDNKPVYSCWYTTVLNATSANLLSITRSNYGRIWINTYFTQNSSGSIMTGHYYYASSDFQRCWIEGGHTVMFQGGSSYPTRPYTIWYELRYTKSTD